MFEVAGLVCTVPVFREGRKLDQQKRHRPLDRIENNYGYTGPTATTKGATSAPGIERIDVDSTGTGCAPVWYSGEHAPSAVPKLSLANGLVYAYTKPPRSDEVDA